MVLVHAELLMGRQGVLQPIQARLRQTIGRQPKSEVLEHRPTVLVVQARKNEERVKGEQSKLQALADKGGAQLVFVNPLTEDFHAWDDPRKMFQELGVDGVLFTGSSDVDLTVRTPERDLYQFRVTELAKEAVRSGSRMFDPMPVFGICLGHQMIHQVSGGKVERDLAQMETGTGGVILTRRGTRDPYITDVPLIRDAEGQFGFLEIFGHKDTVVKRARGFRLLGSTKRNEHSLTRKRGVFTTQGHPEITDASGLRRAIEQAKGHDARMGDYDQNYPIDDTPGVDTMLVNFFGHVAQRVERRKDRFVKR